jgi:hypothetical protein
MVPDQPPTYGAQRQGRARIETQIHRRKKAKAFSSLEPEWDQDDQGPPPPPHAVRPYVTHPTKQSEGSFK